MRLSIIIPVLDEGEGIAAALDALVDLRVLGTELIVVDGGSRDATIQRSRLRSDLVLSAPRGLASQLNAGAEKATGDVLLFLQADMQLPPLADHLILDGLARSEREWGYFEAKLAGHSLLLPIAAWLINLQSRMTGVATSEHAIFAKRSAFRTAGGFPAIPTLENLALSKGLKRIGRPLVLRQRVFTPAGHWEASGVFSALKQRWRQRLDFFFRGDPSAHAKRQAASRDAKD